MKNWQLIFALLRGDIFERRRIGQMEESFFRRRRKISRANLVTHQAPTLTLYTLTVQTSICQICKRHLTYGFLLFICLCTDSFLPQMICLYRNIVPAAINNHCYYFNAYIIRLWCVICNIHMNYEPMCDICFTRFVACFCFINWRDGLIQCTKTNEHLFGRSLVGQNSTMDEDHHSRIVTA